MISTSGIRRDGRAADQTRSRFPTGASPLFGMTYLMNLFHDMAFGRAALEGTQPYASSVMASKIAARDDTEDKKLRKELYCWRSLL
jgi:hypothetical protein